jgi:hypothetical protein
LNSGHRSARGNCRTRLFGLIEASTQDARPSSLARRARQLRNGTPLNAQEGPQQPPATGGDATGTVSILIMRVELLRLSLGARFGSGSGRPSHRASDSQRNRPIAVSPPVRHVTYCRENRRICSAGPISVWLGARRFAKQQSSVTNPFVGQLAEASDQGQNALEDPRLVVNS